MTKETIKTFVITTLILLVVVLSIKTEKCYQEARKQPETKTITVTETLTNIVYDTLFIDHFETVKLPVVDTIIRDSLRIDSIFVEIPISKFQFDTCFTTDTTQLNLSIRNSGYEVTLDSLSYYFEYTPRPIKLSKSNFFKDHFRFGAGVSTGLGVFSKKPDIFMGVGIYYCF